MITLNEWQNGDFRKYPEFSTQEGYYESVRQLIAKYGKRTTKNMLLVRSGDGEHLTGNYGASWTTDLNVCRRNAKRYLVDTIYVTFVPKGTKAVFLPENGQFEEEYILDMEDRSGDVMTISHHSGEWDYRTDFETDEDFDNWHFDENTLTILNIFWKRLIKGLFCKTDA